MNLRLEFLSVARRMDNVVDIIVAKDWQFGRRVANPVVAFPHCFRTQKVVSGGEQGLVAQSAVTPTRVLAGGCSAEKYLLRTSRIMGT